MKKLFLLVLVITLFIACQNASQRYFESSPEIEALNSGIKAYESQDWDAWKSNFSDTAKIFHNTSKGKSLDETVSYFNQMLSNIDSYGFGKDNAVSEMVVDKDGKTWVNYWGHWKGTTKVTNKELHIPVHITAQFVNGKIVQEYVYYDASPVSNAFAEIEKVNNMPVEEKTINDQIEKFVGEFLNKKDASVLGDILDDNFVRYMNDVKESSGSEQLAENMQVFFKGFPDFKITLLHKSPIFNNTRFVHWQMTGTNTGEFNGMPATNKKVKITGLTRIHFNGQGKVDEENVFYDQLNLMQQLGLELN